MNLDTLVEQYKQGAPIDFLAMEYGLNKQSLELALRSRGIELTTESDLQFEIIKQRNKQNYYQRAYAYLKEVNRAPDFMTTTMVIDKIKMIDSRTDYKHLLRSGYFGSITEIKAFKAILKEIDNE
ncbi:hypothetical protein [Vibrio splendidus]|uniref:hypothetical protein n=1 Tax=Vibrio splendidus TaxID=29497 RepID=UPI000D36344C|nr:hypothetical protein [Vibrio splendidus]PTP95463.1 hypothetical protein CWO02_01070 [Vibrio splendidus]